MALYGIMKVPVMPKTPPPPALEELLEQFAWVKNLARTMVREADAEDLAQETMLRAIQSPPRHGQNIRAWLAQISRNISNSNRRRDKRRQAKMNEEAPKPREVPRPDEVFIKQEAGRILREEVDSLNTSERYLILVRYQEGLSVREIAHALDISQKAAQSRLDRAKAKLRQKMKREFGENYLVPCLLLSAPLPASLSVAPAISATAGTILATGGITAWAWKGLAAMFAVLIPYFAFADFDNPSIDLVEPALYAMEADSGVVGQEPGTAERIEILAAPSKDTENPRISLKIPVFDHRGIPLPNAQATVWSRVLSRPNFVWLDPHENSKRLLGQGQADEQGILTVEVEQGKSVMLLIASPLGQVSKQRFTPSKNKIELEPVRLAAGGIIRGEIVDQVGLPIEGVRIMAQFGGKAKQFSSTSYVSHCWSQADGSFEMASLPPGEYALQMARDGYVRTISAPLVVSAERKSAWQTLTLPVGLSMQTQILDSSGNAIPNAKVWCLHESEAPTSEQSRISLPNRLEAFQLSNGEGNVQISGLNPAGRSTLVVTAPGFLSKAIAKVQPNRLPFITLERGLSTSFKVTSQQKPVAGAKVRLSQSLGLHSYTKTGSSSANGLVVFQDLRPGIYQASVIDERGSFKLPPFEISRSGQKFQIPLDEGAGFSFLGLDPEGNGVPGLPIQMVFVGQLPGTAPASLRRGEFPHILGQTDGLGQFQIKAFAGIWEVMVQTKGMSKLVQKVHLAQGETFNLKHTFQATGAANITAVDSAGAALARLNLVLMPVDRPLEAEQHRTDDHGVWSFDNLRPGLYSIFPWIDQAPSTAPTDSLQIEIVAGVPTNCLLTTDQVCRTTILLLQDQVPVYGAELSIKSMNQELSTGFDSREPRARETKPDGTHGPVALPAGRYQVFVKPSAGMPEQRFELSISPGTKTYTLELEGAEIVGRLADDSGMGLAGIHVELERWVLQTDGQGVSFASEAPRSSRGIGPVHTLSGPDGYFRFAMVPEGNWQIRVRAGSLQKPQTSAIHGDGQNPIDVGTVTLQASCSLKLELRGDALDATRLPASKSPVGLLHLETGYFYLMYPDRQGNIERNDLPAGEFEIRLGERQPELIRLNPDSKTERILH
jgi:RNA polymerase sigma-70 factor, ECF subfamily